MRQVSMSAKGQKQSVYWARNCFEMPSCKVAEELTCQRKEVEESCVVEQKTDGSHGVLNPFECLPNLFLLQVVRSDFLCLSLGPLQHNGAVISFYVLKKL